MSNVFAPFLIFLPFFAFLFIFFCVFCVFCVFLCGERVLNFARFFGAQRFGKRFVVDFRRSGVLFIKEHARHG